MKLQEVNKNSWIDAQKKKNEYLNKWTELFKNIAENKIKPADSSQICKITSTGKRSTFLKLQFFLNLYIDKMSNSFGRARVARWVR